MFSRAYLHITSAHCYLHLTLIYIQPAVSHRRSPSFAVVVVRLDDSSQLSAIATCILLCIFEDTRDKLRFCVLAPIDEIRASLCQRIELPAKN